MNNKLVEGEVELKDGDTIKVGPLDFKVALSVAAAGPKPPAKPAPAVTVGGEPDADETVELSAPPSDGPSSDKLAALLLEDDGSAPKPANTLGPEAIPEGSTIMDVPTPAPPSSAGGPATPTTGKKPVLGSGNTSDAAAEILKRYQRRPRS